RDGALCRRAAASGPAARQLASRQRLPGLVAVAQAARNEATTPAVRAAAAGAPCGACRDDPLSGDGLLRRASGLRCRDPPHRAARGGPDGGLGLRSGGPAVLSCLEALARALAPHLARD